jgi:hypothetical protein
LVLLCVAAVFLGLAIVFGVLAFFRTTAPPNGGQTFPSPVRSPRQLPGQAV